MAKSAAKRKRKTPAKMTEVGRGVLAGLEDAKAYLKGGKSRAKVVPTSAKAARPPQPKPKSKRRAPRAPR